MLPPLLLCYTLRVRPCDRKLGQTDSVFARTLLRYNFPAFTLKVGRLHQKMGRDAQEQERKKPPPKKWG